MKTTFQFPVCCNTWYILAIYLVLSFSATAQDVHYRDPQDPSKGHWLLFTDPATLSTRIQFFDANKHLLYEEVLSDKYIRLTERNINRINQAFDLITQNNLVLTKVKANPLSPVSNNQAFSRRNPAHRYPGQPNASSLDNAGSNIKLHTFKIANTCKFYVIFQNPDQKGIRIQLKNEVGKILFTELVNSATYRRKFDFAGTLAEKYTLVVTSRDRKYRFIQQIEMRSFPATQTLEVKPATPALITSNKSVK